MFGDLFDFKKSKKKKQHVQLVGVPLSKAVNPVSYSSGVNGTRACPKNLLDQLMQAKNKLISLLMRIMPKCFNDERLSAS